MAILRPKTIPAGFYPMGPASKIRCAAGKIASRGLKRPALCDAVRIRSGPRPQSREAEHNLIVEVNIVGVYAEASIRV
jgi:hypothetical protein